MPYKLSRNGLSVLNANTGQVIKKHPNKKRALAHLRALQANVPEASNDSADESANKSGQDSMNNLIARASKVLASKAFDAQYASLEALDIYNASQIQAQLALLAQSEAAEGEPEDVAEIADIITALQEFISGEIEEMVNADDGIPEPMEVSTTEQIAGKADKFGGKPRGKLKDTDFVFSDERAFPIMTSADVSDAVSSWGRYKGKHSFADFQKELTALAKRKGFEKQLPDKWQEENKPAKSTSMKVGARLSRDSVSALHDIRDKAMSLCQCDECIGMNGGAFDEEDAADNADDEAAEGEMMGKTATFKAAPISFNYIKRLHLPQTEQFFKDVIAVKSIGADTIRGYSMLWGDPSLVDVEMDFFKSDTNFWDQVLPAIKPLTWDHAQDKSFKSSPLIGEVQAFGNDEIGRWYEAQLKRNHAYRNAIDSLISQKALGTSSDSVLQYVVREPAKNGANWIKEWPWFASALTTTPAEPRMLDVGSPYWKSIGQYKSITDLVAERVLSASGKTSEDMATLKHRLDILRLDA